MEKLPHQEYRDDLADKLKEIRNSDSETAKHDAKDHLDSFKKTKEYDNARYVHIELLKLEKEKDETYLREKFPKEKFLADFNPRRSKEFAELRYQECIEFCTQLAIFKIQYLESLDDLSVKYLPWILRRMPKTEEYFEYASRQTEPFSYPFVGLIDLYPEIDKLITFKPDIIAVAPKSAILPSIAIKEMVEEYKTSSDGGFDPYFFIPPNKAYKLRDERNQAGKFSGVGEIIAESSGSGKLDVQKQYLLDIYSEKNKPKNEEEADFIKQYFEACDSAKKVILSQNGDKKEIRVLVFDEYINYGQNSKGLCFLFEVALEMLKIEGKVENEVEVITSTISTQNDSFSNNLPGKGYISDDNYGQKGGSQPEHWLTRKIFKLIGKYTMRDYLLQKDNDVLN